MTKSMLLVACATAVLLPIPAAAQMMPGMKMDMPMPKPKAKPKPVVKTPSRRAAIPSPSPSPSPSPAGAGAHSPAVGGEALPPVPSVIPTGPRPAPGKEEGLDAPMPDMAPSPVPASPADPDPHAGHAMQDMPGMAMPTSAAAYGEGSGTSRNPAGDGAMHGVHLMAGDWAVMLHGYAWGSYTDQGGPRGDKQAFVASMAMLTASRDLGGARLQLRSMLSLEPAMGAKGYPNLFATGETADGRTPLIDRQHPHDLFMELAARIDVGRVFLYGGPVAEPALGPSAFMHRASASYQPLAPITHHWFDSTHISYGVVTAGYAAPRLQLEASAFRGREPDQHRWNIEATALDSWSVRATWTPSPDWALQVSHGFIKSPEQLEAFRNEGRTTASVQYGHGGVSALIAFSAKDKQPGPVLTAWLGEVNWDIDRHHTIFARGESVANDELFPNPLDPLHDRPFRIAKLEGGYAYRLRFVGPFDLALGGAVGVYGKPRALDAAYGAFPLSFSLFAKLSLGH